MSASTPLGRGMEAPGRTRGTGPCRRSHAAGHGKIVERASSSAKSTSRSGDFDEYMEDLMENNQIIAQERISKTRFEVDTTARKLSCSATLKTVNAILRTEKLRRSTHPTPAPSHR